MYFLQIIPASWCNWRSGCYSLCLVLFRTTVTVAHMVRQKGSRLGNRTNFFRPTSSFYHLGDLGKWPSIPLGHKYEDEIKINLSYLRVFNSQFPFKSLFHFHEPWQQNLDLLLCVLLWGEGCRIRILSAFKMLRFECMHKCYLLETWSLMQKIERRALQEATGLRLHP